MGVLIIPFFIWAAIATQAEVKGDRIEFPAHGGQGVNSIPAHNGGK